MLEARERFEELTDGEITTFHAPLRQGERGALECLADEYEMWFACNETIGFVVGKVNEFAAWAERELERLRPGERCVVEDAKTSEEHRIVRLLSQDCALWPAEV